MFLNSKEGCFLFITGIKFFWLIIFFLQVFKWARGFAHSFNRIFDDEIFAWEAIQPIEEENFFSKSVSSIFFGSVCFFV